MGLLDLLRGALDPTAAAVIGTERGHERRRQRDRTEAREDYEIARQKKNDAIAEQLQQSQINEHNARAKMYGESEGVQWVIDANGNYVPLPKKMKPASTTDASPTSATPPAAGPANHTQRSPLGTLRETVRGKTGSTMQEPTQQPAVTPAAKPTLQIGQPSGVQARPRNIDPNSTEGISADSSKALNRARARAKYPTRGRSGSSVNPDQRDLNQQFSNVERQVSDTRSQMAALSDPARAASYPGKGPAQTAAWQADLQKLQQRLDSLRGVSDELSRRRQSIGTSAGQNEPDVDADSTGTGDIDLSDENKPASTYSQSKEQNAAMQKEMSKAADDLNAVLGSDLPPDKKSRARKAYDKRLRAIAEKYDATSPNQ